MPLLDMVRKLPKVKLGEILVSVETILAETKLGEATHHVTLATLEASSNGSTSPRILSLMTFTSRLSKATSRSSTDSLLSPLGSWVVPQIVGREGQKLLIVHLLRIQAVKGSKHPQ